jgi:hypothetical protein
LQRNINALHLLSFYIKNHIMKKLLFVVSISVSALISACGGGGEKKDTPAPDSSATVQPTPTPPADTTASTTTPAIKDSVMQFKGGKVLISVSGSWSELSAPVTTTNGRKVKPNGDVSKSGKTRKLEEGMMIDKDGQLMDKNGKPLDNTGWE